MPKAQANKSSGGWKIPLFGKQTGRTAIRARDANDLVGPLNALGRLIIRRNPAALDDKVIYSDGNVVLEIAGQVTREAPTTVSFKRGEITAIAGDYVTVAQWDEDASDFTGGTVYVAKPMHLRNSVTAETIWGVSITYGSYQSNTIERTATYNSKAVKQRVFPPYLVGDEIYFADTSEAVGVSDYTKIDANIAGRGWWTETEGCDSDTGDPIYSFVARCPWTDTAVGSNFA